MMNDMSAHALVLSMLLYAVQTRSLPATDVRSLEACHQKFQTDAWIHWHDRISNHKVLQDTREDTLPHFVSTRRAALFTYIESRRQKHHSVGFPTIHGTIARAVPA